MTANKTDKLVVFAHGKESGPWGTKITRLAEVARARGYEVISPDYSHTHDPKRRVEQLLALSPKARKLVLCGSSMGGYVSAQACAKLKPQALFLMAPALYFPGWDEEPAGCPAMTTVVHGWKDEVVPADVSKRFASAQKTPVGLHLLNSGHTLNDQLPVITRLFDELLERLDAA